MSIWDQFAQFLVSGLTTGSIYALIALGFCITHNSTGIVNFTQVDFISLGGLVMYSCLFGAGVPIPAAFCLSVLAVTLVAAMVERFAIRPAKSRAVIVLIFITIGVSILMRGVFKLLWGKNQMAVPSFSGEAPVVVLNAAILPQSLWIFFITAVVVIFLHVFFNKTQTGKAMRAASFNRRAAALMGINVDRMVLLSFALSGALGAVAGIIIVPITTLSYSIGVMLGLKGFAAAVLGGYGNSVGAVLGGLTLGVLESLGAGMISSTYKDVIAFTVLLLVLFMKPSGLLGHGEKERV
ncbi:MAG TPA: branched-chain amino acid ABC transporter permease [Desulfomonilaceae bacterium]|nr:branched-chain amino acid ABC transporter permease [Desulfomonilaceae bacterium]